METATTVPGVRGDNDPTSAAIRDRNPLCYLSTCLSPPCSVAVVVPIHHHHNNNNRDHDDVVGLAAVGGDRYRGGTAGRPLWRRIARKVLKESKSFYSGGSGLSDAGCSCGRATIGGASSGGSGGGRKQSMFRYDAVSYLQNFDEGRGTQAAAAAAAVTELDPAGGRILGGE